MARGIDHLVLVVHDLEAARETYRRLGFTLTPIAHHPWGTSNSLVQLDGNFLELLAIHDADRIKDGPAGAFSFGTFCQRFAEQREGFAMLVLESHDPDQDRADFEAAGLQVYRPFSFERDAALPDGSVERIGFSLTFTSHPGIAEAGFFTCYQHNPAAFWKPQYQVHENTGQQISEVIMVADDPDRFAAFYQGFSGSNRVETRPGEWTVSTPRGRISVMTPDTCSARIGADYGNGDIAGPHFAAYKVRVSDLRATERALSSEALDVDRIDGRIVVGAAQAHGATILFEE